MRILFSDRAGELGGAVYSLYWLATALSRSHQVSVGVRGEPPYTMLFRKAGLTVFPIAGRLIELKGPVKRHEPLRKKRLVRLLVEPPRFVIESLPLSLRFAAILRRARPDVVHLNGSPTFYQAEALGSWMAGVPVICHLRGPGTAQLFPLDRWLISLAEQFIAVSHATAEASIAAGYPADRMHVIHNCTPLSPEISERERLESRRREGLADGCWAVTAGRLLAWKGIREAIHAVARVRARGVDLRLLILGDGPEGSSLRADAARLKLGAAIRFAGWQSDPARYFALADILLHPSQGQEPFGRSIIEGMACGVPVVGIAFGGIPETFTDGASGLLVHGGGAEPLVEPLEAPARGTERRRAMGRAARQEVARRFGVEPHVAAVEAVYTQVLRDAAARGR